METAPSPEAKTQDARVIALNAALRALLAWVWVCLAILVTKAWILRDRNDLRGIHADRGLAVFGLIVGGLCVVAFLFSRSALRVWRRQRRADDFPGLIVFLFFSSVPFVTIPEFLSLIARSDEGATRGSLGSLRAAIAAHRGDHGGRWPADLEGLKVDGQLRHGVPLAKTPHFHPASPRISYGSVSDDSGGWRYNNAAEDPHFGEFWVNCTHTDTKGTTWSSY
ncbi:MAG: hypothetical protein HY077_08875 [Elusimicrobia bacterium]|nr:hypothetical protein [Elusimicrobiota bacterium]